MCSQKELDIIIITVKKMYHEQYQDRIKKVYLYGSYARGDNDEYSDIDIVAIVDGKREELQDKLKTIWTRSAKLGYDNDVIISPAVIPYSEFEKFKDAYPYYRNIANEGIDVS